MLSVIIPARNETYLERTIKNVLKNSRGEIEIIVILDGWIPDPQIKTDNRVTFLHYKDSIGQRKAINEGVKRCKGKYIMKLDAHCAVDEGFDVKLAQDCEYDWTVVPRMYNLDHKTWLPKRHKLTDYMYISSMTADKPFRAMYYTGKEYHKLHKNKALIDDIMCCMGPCFFMYKDRFLELGGCDEAHGGWGQQGVEVSLKAWLSGGSLKVNKKTWFAHWFRGDVGFPYSLSGKAVQKARKYSQNLWLNNKWDKQTRKLDWVINKFNPPEWEKETDGMTVIYYTANILKGYFERSVIKQLEIAVKDKPVVYVSQKPLKRKNNIIVGDIGISNESIFRQILKGCESVKTKYVALAESDCLYTPEHFNFIPPKDDVFYYNENNWYAFWNGDHKAKYSYVKRKALSQLICNRKLLIEAMKRNINLIDKGFIIRKGKAGACEPGACNYEDAFVGTKNMWEGVKESNWSSEYFNTKLPNIDIRHGNNLNKGKRGSKIKKDTLPYWGEFYPFWNKQLLKRYDNFNYGAIHFKVMDVEYLRNNRLKYARLGGEESVKWFNEVFPPFMQKIHDGKIKWTTKEFEQEPYYKYLASKVHPNDRNPLTERGKKRVLYHMKDAINLYTSIKKNGLMDAIEMVRQKDSMFIIRGGRRIEILWLLGHKTVPIRLYKNKEVHELLSKPPKITHDNSINSLGAKQFAKLSHNTTDKYWVHQYLPKYDIHFSDKREINGNILEIGVLRGASLLLWKDAFPNAKIYGIDKNPKLCRKLLDGVKNIEVKKGRQEDEEFIRKEITTRKYSIIIDDGGHNPNDIKKSFQLLWDSLEPNGIYVIEDLCGNYRPDRIMMGTAIDMLKDLVDDINIKARVKSIHFYYNICFIEKTR